MLDRGKRLTRRFESCHGRNILTTNCELLLMIPCTWYQQKFGAMQKGSKKADAGQGLVVKV